MSTMKKTILAAFIMTGIGVNMAHANSIIVDGAGVNATAEVVFGEITTIQNTLTPVSGLAAGNVKDGLKVANGMIHSLDGKAHLFVVRFGPEGTDLQHYGSTGVPAATFAGKNDPAHKITLRLNAYKGADDNYSNDNENYGLTLARRNQNTGPESAKTVGYQLFTAGDQPISADTYTISTVAYTYTL